MEAVVESSRVVGGGADRGWHARAFVAAREDAAKDHDGPAYKAF